MKRFLPLIIGLTFFLIKSTAAATPHDEIKKQVDLLNQRMESNMRQSSKLIEKGDYQSAQDYTESLIKDLDVLIEAVMPLDERIKQLIAKENDILDQTRTAEKLQNTAIDKTTPDGKLDDLIHHQTANREKTETTSDLVEQQLRKPGETNPSAGKQTEVNQKHQVLKEVRQLVDSSARYQTAAIADLEKQSLLSATNNEIKAVEYLEKALEKLKQHSPQQSQSQEQSNSGQQQKQQQSQNKESASQDNKSDQQQPSQQSQQTKAEAKPGEEKMSPKAALKELNRLRKLARDEQERRRKQMGIQLNGEQVPVDKDW